MVGYAIFRGSNSQKNEFRKNPYNPALARKLICLDELILCVFQGVNCLIFIATCKVLSFCMVRSLNGPWGAMCGRSSGSVLSGQDLISCMPSC